MTFEKLKRPEHSILMHIWIPWPNNVTSFIQIKQTMSKELQRQGLNIGLGRNFKLKESQLEKSSTDWNILSISWSNNVISFNKIKQTILKSCDDKVSI